MKITRLLFCTFMVAVGGCAGAPRDEPLRAETGVAWGGTAGGLQIGVTAETPTAPPGLPAPALPDRLRVYLKNNGVQAIRVIQPSAARMAREAGAVREAGAARAAGAAPLVVILAGPGSTAVAATPVVTLPRPESTKVVGLVPSEMMSFAVDLAPEDVRSVGTGTVTVAARYENHDPVVFLAPPENSRPPTEVQGIWVGEVRSGDVKLTVNR